MEHTFVIPVFRSAPRLGVLLESLRSQSTRSQILLTTSTPSPELHTFADHHGIPLHINPERIGIAADWNFALASARTAFVTLAHQDDLFAPCYVAQLTTALRPHPDALFAFCDYSEHTACGTRPINLNLRIKRALCRRAFGRGEYVSALRQKRRLLSLGNPICCTSVMLNRALLADFRFPEGLQTNLDWRAWIELARRPGGFIYVRDSLVSKGIHPESETTLTIANRVREHEDQVLFEVLWPRPIAAALATVYKLGYRANRVVSGLAHGDAGDANADEHDAHPLQR